MGWFQRFQHRNTQPLSPSRPSVSANLGGLLKPFSGVVPNSGWLKYPKYSSPMFLFFYHQLSPGYPVVNIQKSMEDHHLLWENSLFLWPCSIAILTNYQRVCLFDSFGGYGSKFCGDIAAPWVDGHCGPSTGPLWESCHHRPPKIRGECSRGTPEPQFPKNDSLIQSMIQKRLLNWDLRSPDSRFPGS